MQQRAAIRADATGCGAGTPVTAVPPWPPNPGRRCPPHPTAPAAGACRKRQGQQGAANTAGAAGTATAGVQLQNQQPEQNPSGKAEEGKGVGFCLARPRSNTNKGCQPASQPLQLPCVCLPAASP